MANYETLKAAIAAVIKQNGNNEITGNALQQQLLAMVNSLGVAYQYAGIATPATNPGTPDQNLFYIASTAGTYTNFNGFVLTDGEVAILKYNGAWSKDSTGAASLDKLNQSVLNADDGIVLIDSKTAYAPSSYFKNPLVVGEKYEVTNLGDVVASFWAYDSAKQGISAITGNISPGATIEFTFNTNNAAFIGGWTNSFTYKISLKKVDEIQASITEIRGEIQSLNNEVNGKISRNFLDAELYGMELSSASQSWIFAFEIKTGDVLYFANNGGRTSVYTTNDNKTTGYTIVETVSASFDSQKKVRFVAQQNAKYLVGYCSTSDLSVLVIRDGSVKFIDKEFCIKSPILTEENVSFINGYYIHGNPSAGIFPGNNVQVTEPIFVKKGTAIRFWWDASITYGGTYIAKTDIVGSSYSAVTGTISRQLVGGVAVYDYVAEEDMYIAISGPTSMFGLTIDSSALYLKSTANKNTLTANITGDYSVRFPVEKGKYYKFTLQGTVGASCFTRVSETSAIIDKIISEQTVDVNIPPYLNPGACGILRASADANFITGYVSQSGVLTVEELDALSVVDKEYKDGIISNQPNIIWQCREGRVSSTRYPNQSKWAIEETARNQYDRIRFSIQKSADGQYFLCHDLTINNLARNPDGSQISETITAANLTIAELNAYDWGIKYGDKFAGMDVPMLADGLYYANLFNLAVTAEFKFQPTQEDVNSLWNLLCKYNCDKNLIINMENGLASMRLFSVKSPYISFGFGGSISWFRSALSALQELKTQYNQIFVLIYSNFGTPPTDEEIAEVKSEGFATWYTPIFNESELFDTLGFAKGVDLIECANIPFIKSTVRNYAQSLIIWP